MSMATLEREILYYLQEITNKPGLRKKDIAEWSTGSIDQIEGETRFFLPIPGVNVAIRSDLLVDKRKKKIGVEAK